VSFNGAGNFSINTTGQPVVAGTVISDTVFNALTADLATGLSTCITKDGQTTVTANIPMSSFKFTGLAAGSASGDSVRYEQVVLLSNGPIEMCEFRMTLTTGVPVTTSDVTAATTIYVAPYKGNRIALYDGSATWNILTSAEMSIAVPATTATMYDLFCYDNAGTATLEALAWTNDTTRATALTTQNGVLVKTGAVTRRYLGSFRTAGVSGQTEDSLANRFVWNYYNRVRRPMRVAEASASWNYSTATIRQANGAAGNLVSFVIGVSEDIVRANVWVAASSNTPASAAMESLIGLDSTSSGVANAIVALYSPTTNGYTFTLNPGWAGFPGAGKHYLSWLEKGNGTATNTWYGATTDGNSQLYGELNG
jgi:uncharacterized protein (DUF2147 family)